MVHVRPRELLNGIAYQRLVRKSHYYTTRILLLGLGVKHLHRSSAQRLPKIQGWVAMLRSRCSNKPENIPYSVRSTHRFSALDRQSFPLALNRSRSSYAALSLSRPAPSVSS